MLDSETKRKIDTLRDILVGKIPNPQSQVEQITTGLIYKFMNDMDEESIELGGDASFFVGDYKKYSWNNLFDSKLGGVDKVNLYSEAIENMYLNPAAPKLFRDIFKNAFLPFKDPSTLNMFLKEINDFHYSHSEKLGDAFEYLISIMGSQGDAGQFRTPRHIIDFIVEIVNPKKDETILDPGCGTAGFLISSYKHILKSNTATKSGDQLSAEDRKIVGENLSGYDISPEMIRLSLVNMYLHGFKTPKVDEYDTLSSEDKWNEYFDVILANPPFFSPKGGIQPHKRFGVDSKKAEVLFTSYILEHLKPNGRAGIIVPEGIIFQSGKAYKELRKQLIENGLIGVISLPSGIFNPYSGVKTSILFINKKISKSEKDIFFAYIKNDGFSLGAKRTPINENDIPNIINSIRKNKTSDNFFRIKKERILDSKNTSFVGRSFLDDVTQKSIWKMKKIKDVCQINPNKSEIKELDKELQISFVPMQDLNANEISFKPKETKKISEVYKKGYSFFINNDVLLAKVTPCFENGKSGVARNLHNGIGFGSTEFHVLRTHEDLDPNFLYRLINDKEFIKKGIERFTGTSGLKRVPKDFIENYLIPIPPKEIQTELEDAFSSYQNIIDGCKQVVENYKPTIEIDPSWEMVELGDIFENFKDSILPAKIKEKSLKYVGLENIGQGTGNLEGNIDCDPSFIKSNKSVFNRGDILYGKLRPNLNKVLLAGFEGICSTDILVLRKKDSQESIFYQSIFLSDKFNSEVMKGITGAQLPRVNFNHLKQIKIPNPSVNTQKEIVQKIEEERKVIEGNKKLIEVYTQKIQDRINKVWGE